MRLSLVLLIGSINFVLSTPTYDMLMRLESLDNELQRMERQMDKYMNRITVSESILTNIDQRIRVLETLRESSTKRLKDNIVFEGANRFQFITTHLEDLQFINSEATDDDLVSDTLNKFSSQFARAPRFYVAGYFNALIRAEEVKKRYIIPRLTYDKAGIQRLVVKHEMLRHKVRPLIEEIELAQSAMKDNDETPRILEDIKNRLTNHLKDI